MRNRFIRRPEVQKITGLGRSTIYAMMKRGEFPKPIRLTGKAVAWTESSLSTWMASRQDNPAEASTDA